MKLFRKQYPNLNLEIIDIKKYKELRNKYKKLISNWEG